MSEAAACSQRLLMYDGKTKMSSSYCARRQCPGWGRDRGTAVRKQCGSTKTAIFGSGSGSGQPEKNNCPRCGTGLPAVGRRATRPWQPWARCRCHGSRGLGSSHLPLCAFAPLRCPPFPFFPPTTPHPPKTEGLRPHPFFPCCSEGLCYCYLRTGNVLLSRCSTSIVETYVRSFQGKATKFFLN